MAKTDNFNHHVRDTLSPGAGLCNEKVVRSAVQAGPESIADLLNIAVDFVKGEDDSLSLAREGRHSKRRVAHVFDLTGRASERPYPKDTERKKLRSIRTIPA